MKLMKRKGQKFDGNKKKKGAEAMDKLSQTENDRDCKEHKIDKEEPPCGGHGGSVVCCF